MPDPTTHCPSCGAAFTGPWCAACGERRLGPGMRGLGHYLGEAWQAVSDTDGRLWQSLWTLLRRPGRLTRAWWAGRRRPYLGPVQLFLLVSVAFFLLSPFDLFSTPLRFHLHLDFLQHRDVARELVHRRIAHEMDPEAFFGEVAVLRARGTPIAEAKPPHAREKADYGQFEAAFDQRSSALARALVFVMIPMLALGSLLLAVALRAPRAPTLHLVYATHFLAFTQACALLMGAVLHPVWVAKVAARLPLAPHLGIDLAYSVLFLVLLGAYLVLAARTALGLGWRRALPHALGMTLVLLFCWNKYRALLFFLTFYSLESPP